LGAAEFGKYSLVLSLSQFFLVPMMFGFYHASTRYIAGSEDNRSQKDIIATALQSVALFIALTILVLLIALKPVTHLLVINTTMYLIAIGMSALTALFIIGKSVLLGLQKFKQASVIETASSFVTIIAGLSLLFIFQMRTFITPAVSYMLGTLVMIIAIYVNFRHLFGTFNRVWFKKLFEYGLYATIGGIATALINTSDKIVINRYFDPSVLGIYSAYLAVSNSVITNRILGVVTNVLLPVTSRKEQKSETVNVIDRLSPRIFLYIFVFNMVFLFVMFKLYGHEYPFNSMLALIFSLNISIFFINQLFGIILGSNHIHEFKYAVYAILIVGILNAILNFTLTPRFGIYMAAVILLFTNCCLYFSMRRIAKQMI
jgi:O-antigen/teichoic acid export membrane protein